MKSPCVKDCPDRLPCGACRKSCEAFREYEAQPAGAGQWDYCRRTYSRQKIHVPARVAERPEGEESQEIGG